jgi:hypothetical protein
MPDGREVAAPADSRCLSHAAVTDRRFSPVQCDHEAGHVGHHAAARHAKDTDTEVSWQWSDADSIPAWVPRAHAHTVEPSLARKLLKRILG